LSTAPRRTHAFERGCGALLYAIAYGLSPLRLPFCVLPYLVKLFLYFVFNLYYTTAGNRPLFEILRVTGDVLNWALVAALLALIAGQRDSLPAWLALLYAVEAIRLITEKGMMVFSGVWQYLPHWRIACWLQSHPLIARHRIPYCEYYALNDEERLRYALAALKQHTSLDVELAQRLSYVSAFRIVPDDAGLRAGRVRDIAKGEIFIHRRWTNDLWLLWGQAIRRSPWIFDPRYLRRPFYYRTEANRLMTLCVLQYARYCLPYAVFQFGHELKAARYDWFYRFMRRLGVNLEETVRADGDSQFDPLIVWLDERLGRRAPPALRSLWSDDETIADIRRRQALGETLSALTVAEQYAYPLKYVEEILLIRRELSESARS